MLPTEIRQHLEDHYGTLNNYQPASGGCINHGAVCSFAQQHLFIKWNDVNSFMAMFEAEANGLNELRKSRFKIPEVLGLFSTDQFTCLVMEAIISSTPSANYWHTAGRQLAQMHQLTAERYGLDHSNYMGSLPQDNHYNDNWITFFTEQRLRPQIEQALETDKLTHQDAEKFEKLVYNLPNLLSIERPSLVHGDLWNGNMMVGMHGEPVLIDPAVAYCHREVDIAMTTLFGGFSPSFYVGYQEVYPLEKGYQSRLAIYNLYPLLVHVNLFGGGYYAQTMSIVNQFI